jgi:hypothetical protein
MKPGKHENSYASSSLCHPWFEKSTPNPWISGHALKLIDKCCNSKTKAQAQDLCRRKDKTAYNDSSADSIKQPYETGNWQSSKVVGNCTKTISDTLKDDAGNVISDTKKKNNWSTGQTNSRYCLTDLRYGNQ